MYVRRSRRSAQASPSIYTFSDAADKASTIWSSPSENTTSHSSAPAFVSVLALLPTLRSSQGDDPGDGMDNIVISPSSDTGRTSFRSKKRSYNASNSSLSGSSLDAPTTQRIGQTSRDPAPLSKRRSFRTVRRVFKIAEFALKISSRNATDAVGRNPSVTLRYSSFSRARRDNGPKISSGVVKRVKRRWKNNPPHNCDNLLPNADFPVPGGPRSNTCSRASVPRTIRRDSSPRSTSPSSTRRTADLSSERYRQHDSSAPLSRSTSTAALYALFCMAASTAARSLVVASCTRELKSAFVVVTAALLVPFSSLSSLLLIS
mmetsp:Transcript_10043/g.14922  ORF Transcript_10043/g.14922 Transcript_10043/m.14922 type:complete len:318 (+) Transcript_10043:1073-2026(+)